MSAQDRARWDQRYMGWAAPAPDSIGPAPVFEPFTGEFPTVGRALDVACGQGTGAIWLARRGLQVAGFDVSPVAIEAARTLAARSGVGDRCRFEIADFDDGLPEGPTVDVVYCAWFRDPRLDAPIAARLAPGGVLAVCALSQVGAAPGRFRAAPGELRAAFADFDRIADGEAAGVAWLLARRRTDSPVSQTGPLSAGRA